MNKNMSRNVSWAGTYLAGAVVVIGMVLVQGCSSDNDAVVESFQQFEGVLGNGAESGSLSVMVVQPVAGTFVLGGESNLTGDLTIAGGASYTVNGLYSNGNLSLTAGPYTVAGTQVGQTISGSYTRTGGQGGGFLLAGVLTGVTPVVYCGSYVSDDRSDFGVWSLIRRGDTLTGMFYSDVDDEFGLLNGGVSGSQLSLSFSDGAASGSIDGTDLSGTWQSSVNEGTWSGATSQCDGGAG